VLSSTRRLLNRLVDETPGERNRVVDAMRALSMAVVVVWHWSLSLTHRDDSGALVNPNPLDQVPGAWVATWLLQILPVFFVVGGYANLAAWTSTRADLAGREAAVEFLRQRARRLFGPVAAFVAVWLLVALIVHAWSEGRRPLFETYVIVVNPLWFVGAYLVVVLFVPITASGHRRRSHMLLAGLAVGVAAVDMARFVFDTEAIGWVNFILVWMLVHQLGYLWHDERFGQGWSRRATATAVVGVVGLVTLTSLDRYPRSLVATEETDISHLSPPTAVIVFAALLQLGVILQCRPFLERFLRRRWPWSVVVATNAVIMTVFLWHMTALVVSILVFEAAGGTLGDEATLTWWLTRPLWVIGPALVLAPLLASFGVLEVGRSAGGG
jgi:surface polysaccharide O-acyltransferase-like enzyme